MTSQKNYCVKAKHKLQPAFSLNFSSVGKGPFMDGKAKNIYFSMRGEGGSGVRDMDLPSLGNFLFPYFKTYFMQICCPVYSSTVVFIFDVLQLS